MGVMKFIMEFEALYLWKDPVQSGIVFGSVLMALMSICYFSLISVISYSSLLLLMAVISIKIGIYVAVTFMKKEVTNPILKYSGVDLTVSSDKVINIAKNLTAKFNVSVTELRRLFLVECMADSVKFGLSLWAMTYIGSWFNMMTLIILSWVGLFSIPKLYGNNKAAIDPLLEKAMGHFNDLKSKAEAVIPGAAKGAAATEVKKEE
ncbi:RTN1 [Lepeophtheirus salmonis]|uniref:Reticulon-like protein n=2 Tax=Lepeophtheirus salmonis TaxID=72036 RepID=A0A7R8CNK1_LEPSM|nr:reticulon-1-A-like isoform X1 [Lepeophtheirus salmonis]CAB4060914.1 RTN1 [Lepeophtheirus salmonis]CAF2873924.1 RTN1 [Lepeophtheirus salmonis]